jgi:hypothetical protein
MAPTRFPVATAMLSVHGALTNSKLPSPNLFSRFHFLILLYSVFLVPVGGNSILQLLRIRPWGNHNPSPSFTHRSQFLGESYWFFFLNTHKGDDRGAQMVEHLLCELRLCIQNLYGQNNNASKIQPYCPTF